MAKDIILKIKETEGKAEEQKKQALINSRDDIKAAQQQNEMRFEKKVAEAREKAERVTKSYEDEAQKEQEKLKSETDKQIERLRAYASENMTEAVGFILGRLG